MSSPMHVRKAIHLVSMKAKLQHYLSLRLLLAAFIAAFLLLVTLRALSAHTSGASSTSVHAQADQKCAKLPPSIAETLIYYATSNVTPQQTAAEIAVTARVLARRAPCNFLVFGLGRDSPMWAALNHGGRTVFLEEDASWIEDVTSHHPGLESYHVSYDTKVTDAGGLLALRDSPDCTGKNALATPLPESPCRLALRGLPAVFYEREWDLIMVDAPTGWTPESPGRMTAIYTAGVAARARRAGGGETDVFVHDVDREVEDGFSRAFLCEGYLTEEVGRLRHFVVPSHREREGVAFCP